MTNLFYRVFTRPRPLPDSCIAAKKSLFDYFVGSHKQGWRHRKPKCLRGLEIDDQFMLCGLHDGKVGWQCSAKDLAGVFPEQTYHFKEISSVADQSADLRGAPSTVEAWDGMALRQRDNQSTLHREIGFVPHEQRGLMLCD